LFCNTFALVQQFIGFLMFFSVKHLKIACILYTKNFQLFIVNFVFIFALVIISSCFFLLPQELQ